MVRRSQGDIEATPQLLVRLATGHVVSAALHIVLQLEIPERLRNSSQTANQLAKDLLIDARTLLRVLRALACVGLFREGPTETFCLTANGLQLLKGSSVRAIATWLCDPIHLHAFADFSESAAGMHVDQKAPSESLFKALSAKPSLSRVFDEAMASMTRASLPTLLESLKVPESSNIIDVGGGRGDLLIALLTEHRHCRGVLFDLPGVVGSLNDLCGELAPRCARVAGDFTESVPSGGDLYVLKHILHDWADATAVRILQNIRATVGDRRDVRLYIIESVEGEVNWPAFGSLVDLAMLVVTGGGERSLPQYVSLLNRAGFEFQGITHTSSPLSVIEARVAASDSATSAYE